MTLKQAFAILFTSAVIGAMMTVFVPHAGIAIAAISAATTLVVLWRA